MQNNNFNDNLQVDEIDLKEIFKLLINSKKLIIAITLVITTLGAIYAFQKVSTYSSTALIEIGNYDQDQNHQQLSIEHAETLIKELTINFIHKKQALDFNSDNLAIKSIAEVDRLIQIAYTSTSSATSEKIVNEIIGYIENRHSLLLSNHIQKIENKLIKKIDLLSQKITNSRRALSMQIKSISNQIENINSSLFIQKEKEKSVINNTIIYINSELPAIDNKIKLLNKIIEEDIANLTLLKSNPELLLQRTAQSPTMNEVIFNYKTQVVENNKEKINFLTEKNSLESQLMRLENNELESNEIFDLLQKKDNLSSQLMRLENNEFQAEKIFDLLQEKESAEFELEFLKKQIPTNTQLVGEIKTKAVDSKKELIIILSFIFGLLLSFTMVFIKKLFKNF